MHEYDLIADWYAAQRTGGMGVPEVEALAASLPSGVAALAWGVMFHLRHDEQRQAIARIGSALRPGGWFLFTSGDRHASIDGAPMNGVAFRYHSFSVEGYRNLLDEHGLALEETHTDAGGNIHYLSRRRHPSGAVSPSRASFANS